DAGRAKMEQCAVEPLTLQQLAHVGERASRGVEQGAIGAARIGVDAALEHREEVALAVSPALRDARQRLAHGHAPSHERRQTAEKAREGDQLRSDVVTWCGHGGGWGGASAGEAASRVPGSGHRAIATMT